MLGEMIERSVYRSTMFLSYFEKLRYIALAQAQISKWGGIFTITSCVSLFSIAHGGCDACGGTCVVLVHMMRILYVLVVWHYPYQLLPPSGCSILDVCGVARRGYVWKTLYRDTPHKFHAPSTSTFHQPLRNRSNTALVVRVHQMFRRLMVCGNLDC